MSEGVILGVTAVFEEAILGLTAVSEGSFWGGQLNGGVILG